MKKRKAKQPDVASKWDGYILEPGSYLKSNIMTPTDKLTILISAISIIISLVSILS